MKSKGLNLIKEPRKGLFKLIETNGNQNFFTGLKTAKQVVCLPPISDD